MTDVVLNHFLKSKKNNQTEIEIHLFEFCNLSCDFCGQDHDSEVGFDTILEKANDVITFMDKSLLSKHIVNIMGGEIFNDEIPDILFERYYSFAKKVIDHAHKTNQEMTINWVTNLIFKKRERVSDFMISVRKLNQDNNISTSYDFDGRGYQGKVNSLFSKNLFFFKDYIYTVGFVLTAPAIESYLSVEDPLFDLIYDKFTLYFDYYVPELRSSDRLMPTDRQLCDAFIYTAHHYPNVYPVKDWLTQAKNKMTCYSLNKVTILPDGEHVTCRYLKYEDNSFKNKVDYNSNENIVSSYINDNQCLSCEWFERCSFRCFVQADWAKREAMVECLYKEFFNEVQDKLQWN